MSGQPEFSAILILRTIANPSKHGLSLFAFCLLTMSLVDAPRSYAQVSPPEQGPVAVVPLDVNIPGAAASVTGVTRLAQGTAILGTSGTVTAGHKTAKVLLPGRGTLSICATTIVRLTVNQNVRSGEIPSLLIAMDRGAVEASIANGHDSDMLLTPDFRILLGGSGTSDVKVRLGEHGDTCVDNAGANAKDVQVMSVFEGGTYRVQANQRVMFQHGSLRQVVDQEKESCGCPPSDPQGNEFPLAQSEGLAPNAPQPSFTVFGDTYSSDALSYNAADHAAQNGTGGASEATAAAKPAAKPHKPSPIVEFFHSIGRFFKHIFGAE
jgi:hypothetical protein